MWRGALSRRRRTDRVVRCSCPRRGAGTGPPCCAGWSRGGRTPTTRRRRESGGRAASGSRVPGSLGRGTVGPMSLRRVDRAVADYTALRPACCPPRTSSSSWSPGSSTTRASTTSASRAAPRRSPRSLPRPAVSSPARLRRPAAHGHRPGRRPGHHLRAAGHRRRGRAARRAAHRARRPGPRRGDRCRRPLRLRQPAPAGVEGGPGARGIRPVVLRLDPAADGAPARVGGVRARHPLQGHRPAGAGARPRPAVHPRGRAARARRPRVRCHPGPAAGRARRQPGRRRGRPRPPDQRARSPATFLAGRYSSAGWSRTEHYEWISGLLLELGIASLDEPGLDAAGRRQRGRHRRHGLPLPPGAVRRLDDDLLARFGDAYVGSTATPTAARRWKSRRSHLPA